MQIARWTLTFAAIGAMVAGIVIVPLRVSQAQEPACGLTAPEEAAVEQTVQRLHQYRIIRRNSSTPDLHADMLRGETAALIVSGLGRKDEAEKWTGPLPFSDLSGHSFAGAVSLLQREGIIEGDPDGRFRPNDPIRLTEAKLLLTRLLRLKKATPETVDAILLSAGVDPTVPCPTQRATVLHTLVLLDRALSLPFYARFDHDGSQ